MFQVTSSALRRLQGLLLEHPDDPVVRITLKDLDEARLVFSITLEPTAQADDEIEEIDGVMIAIDAKAVTRMQDITLEYAASEGFRFLHPNREAEDESPLGPFSFN
jgi:Fe-S cluster assembly iron-binding protein IscA